MRRAPVSRYPPLSPTTPRYLPREGRHLIRDDREGHTRLDVGLCREAGAPRGAAQGVRGEGAQLLGAAGDAAQRGPVTEREGVAEQVVPVGERDRRGEVCRRVGGRRCEREVLLRLRLLVAASPAALRPPRGRRAALGRGRGRGLGQRVGTEGDAPLRAWGGVGRGVDLGVVSWFLKSWWGATGNEGVRVRGWACKPIGIAYWGRARAGELGVATGGRGWRLQGMVRAGAGAGARERAREQARERAGVRVGWGWGWGRGEGGEGGGTGSGGVTD